MKLILERDQILAAAMKIETGKSPGLCNAFLTPHGTDMRAWDLLDAMPQFLDALGGKKNCIDYYWPYGRAGKEDRLTFLAFMLAWHDDLTEQARASR